MGQILNSRMTCFFRTYEGNSDDHKAIELELEPYENTIQ